jgi:hypothetical protein
VKTNRCLKLKQQRRRKNLVHAGRLSFVPSEFSSGHDGFSTPLEESSDAFKRNISFELQMQRFHCCSLQRNDVSLKYQIHDREIVVEHIAAFEGADVADQTVHDPVIGVIGLRQKLQKLSV